jgi:hypothetical protein
MKYIKSITESVDNKELTIIRTEDWEGIYFGNELIDEGHSIDFMHILEKHFGFKVDYKYIDAEKFENYFGANCPDTLEEVKMKLDAKKYNI